LGAIERIMWVGILEIFEGKFKVIVILEVHLLHDIEEIVVIVGLW
jgi:hypothetical protein